MVNVPLGNCLPWDAEGIRCDSDLMWVEQSASVVLRCHFFCKEYEGVRWKGYCVHLGRSYHSFYQFFVILENGPLYQLSLWLKLISLSLVPRDLRLYLYSKVTSLLSFALTVDTLHRLSRVWRFDVQSLVHDLLLSLLLQRKIVIIIGVF